MALIHNDSSRQHSLEDRQVASTDYPLAFSKKTIIKIPMSDNTSLS
jgi:hypothetical protein